MKWAPVGPTFKYNSFTFKYKFRMNFELTVTWPGLCTDVHVPKAGIPPGKSNASGGIWPTNLMLKYNDVFRPDAARCVPISPVEFQLYI